MDKQQLSLLVPDWPAPKNILACTTQRGSVVDNDEYSSFNLALHVNDDEDTVSINRLKLKQTLVLPKEPIWLQQVHGTHCIDVSEAITDRPTADASFATRSGHVCAVMTADCLPLLVTDKKGQGVAAIHAGWRGLANGVIKNTLDRFTQALSIEHNDCMIWLGPAISQRYFEVRADVYTTFKARFEDVDEAFIEHAGERDKYFCDLYQLARLELRTLGVNAIYGGDQCTYAQEDRYYSYRRIVPIFLGIGTLISPINGINT